MENNDFQTAIYQILPANLEAPVNVECTRDEQGTSFAVLHHNNEMPTSVPDGYEAEGSYQFNFTYSLDISVIISLVNQSSHCQQFTKAQCKHVFFYTSTWGWNSWVSDRNAQKLDFWGGGPSNNTGCACGVTSTCANTGDNCNCDANDDVWRSDEGNIVERDVLPITSINAGDTGSTNEEFIYTVGPLMCII